MQGSTSVMGGVVPGPSGRDDSGLYILWLALPAARTIEVGRLGTFAFPAGIYAYVGSAQRRRWARVARHLRLEKPRRWHIDYVRPHARVFGISLVPGNRAGECRLARTVADSLGAGIAVPRLGASDCRCPGHLLVLPGHLAEGSLAQLLRALGVDFADIAAP